MSNQRQAGVPAGVARLLSALQTDSSRSAGSTISKRSFARRSTCTPSAAACFIGAAGTGSPAASSAASASRPASPSAGIAPVASVSVALARRMYIDSFLRIASASARGNCSTVASPSRHIVKVASRRPLAVQKPALRTPSAGRPLTSFVIRLCRKVAASSPSARSRARWVSGTSTVPSRAARISATASCMAGNWLSSAAVPEGMKSSSIMMLRNP